MGFVEDPTVIPVANKVDADPVPVGQETNYLSSPEVNQMLTGMQDLRTGVLARPIFAGPSAPSFKGFWVGTTPPPDSTYLWIQIGSVASVSSLAAHLGLQGVAPTVVAAGSPLVVSALSRQLAMAGTAPTVVAAGSPLGIAALSGQLATVGAAPSVVLSTTYRDSFGSNTLANFTTVGTWGISGGTLNCTGSDAGWQWARYNGITTTDGVVQAVYKVTGTHTVYASLIARYVDANNFLLCQLQGANTALQVTIYEYKNGVLSGGVPSTWTATPPGTNFTVGTNYAVRFEFVGTTLKCYLDVGTLTPSTLRVTWTEPNAAWSGVCGVRANSSGTVCDTTFDNLLISADSAATF